MPQLEIKNHKTGEIIYTGHFTSAKACLEQAVADRVCLDYADLRHANLCNAGLDDVVMRYARLDHANLTGANLSEAHLQGTRFSGTVLHGACLCVSDLRQCDFTGSLFGGTDIAGCTISGTNFSTLSAFSLNFIDTAELNGCIYHSSTGVSCAFSQPPLLLQGLPLPVVFMDRHLKIGTCVKTYEDWSRCTNDNIPADRPDSSHIYTFFRKYQDLLQQLRRNLKPSRHFETLQEGFA
ncbi:MAG: pentapeptide repeat-containing protein [Rhodospirillales bacterium]|nr:pentapeptide repeat-containing protein [Rhodospirillales bacterium]MCB9995170.1 pentapeptide repeat-containing protein [Rhodospirillales bacterium]